MMLDIHLHRVYLLTTVFVLTQVAPYDTRLLCRSKVGVIIGEEDWQHEGLSRMDLATKAWTELRYQKSITDIDFIFEPVQMVKYVNMDVVISKYMLLGSANVTAVVGPYSEALSIAAERLGSPYFVTDALDNQRYYPRNLISVLPNHLDVMLVATEVARKYGWKELALIYDNQDGMFFIEKLVQHPSLHVQTWKISHKATVPDIRSYLLEVRELGITNIILFASPRIITIVIEEAFSLSMLSREYSWILPNMTLTHEQLEKYIYTQMNITTFRLLKNFISFSSPLIFKNIAHDEFISTFDSLLALYRALKAIHGLKGHCHWVGLDEIYPLLTLITDTGSTGHISFLHNGRRSGYVVGVFGLNKSEFQQIGYWDSTRNDPKLRLYINDTEIRPPIYAKYPMGKKTVIRVVSFEDNPFLRFRDRNHNHFGNLRYEGLCVDILQALADSLNFQYEIYLLEEGDLQGKNPEQRQDLIVQELKSGRADIAIGALTVTSKHQRLVDFTEPFFTDGISVLMKKRLTEDITTMQPLRPLSSLFWVVLPGVILLLGCSMFLVEKASGGKDSKHRMGACDSLWYTTASFTLRAIDLHPRSSGGKILGMAVWFASLILISSYTANMAALLTVSRLALPINSLEDLALQNQIRYGTLRDSYTSAFFNNSRVPHLQRMWQVMSNEPGALLESTNQGIELVQQSNSNYAFLWDSSHLRYRTYNDCRLYEVGELFGIREYAIGVPKGVHYADKISQLILSMREDGQLQEMETKWWPKRCSSLETIRESTFSDRSPLSLEDTAGIFVILGSGMIVALIVSLVERCFTKKTPKKKQGKHHRLSSHSDRSSRSLCDGGSANGQGNRQAEEPFLLPDYYKDASKGSSTFLDNGGISPEGRLVSVPNTRHNRGTASVITATPDRMAGVAVLPDKVVGCAPSRESICNSLAAENNPTNIITPRKTLPAGSNEMLKQTNIF